MHLTQEDEEELSLLEDAVPATLAAARYQVGQLLWGEDSINSKLSKAIQEYREDTVVCMVYAGLLEESQERKKKLYQLSNFLKGITRKRIGGGK